MKFHNFLYIGIFAFSSLVSCKKEFAEEGGVTTNKAGIKISDGRLAFESNQQFTQLMKEGNQNKNKPDYLINKISSLTKNKFTSLAAMKDVQENQKQGFHLLNNDSTKYKVSFEKLVADPVFSSVLNDKGEVQIDSTIYKVTRYGTFMVHTSKLNKVNALIHKWEKMAKETPHKQPKVQKKATAKVAAKGNGAKTSDYYDQYGNYVYDYYNSSDPNYDPYYNPYYYDPYYYDPYGSYTSVDQGMYYVDNGIYLYDTYGYTQGNYPVLYDDYSVDYTTPYYYEQVYVPELSYVYGVNSLGSFDSSESYIYENLPTYTFGSKTWFGGILEDLRGYDEIHTTYFGSNRRLKVNFYTSSYIVYSAIGVSAKFQKKNWIGWSGTNADELRLGWEAVQYESASGGYSFTPPPAFPTVVPKVEMDFPGTTRKYELFDLRGFGRKITPVIKINEEKYLQQGIKKLYDMVKDQLGSTNPGYIGQKPFSFLTYSDVFNDNLTITVSRDETKQAYTETLRRSFEWQTGTVYLSMDLTTGNIKYSGNYMNSIADPYKLKAASIYGIAKYAGEYKGIRIIKE